MKKEKGGTKECSVCGCLPPEHDDEIHAAVDASRSWWTPCTLGLPEEEEEVIVFGLFVGMAFARKSWEQGSHPDHWRLQFGDRWEMSDVTHWMKIPEIPK